jgi:tetratricopeptide (TPR) repeat protein
LKNKNLVDSKDQDKVNYQIAKGLFKKGDYGLAQSYAQKVKTSDKNYEGAQYILSLAQVMQGQIGKALKTQEALLSRMRQKGVKGADKKSEEVKTLVAINLARTHFEKGSYSKALEYFREVDSNHPLRLSTLVELGWAQINAKDYPGAVGNMHSLHIPKYKLVYQPESHVVRTIGYLNMCQYGDAYKSLRVLEHKYKPWLDKMTAYSRVKSKSGHYDTLRRYLSQGDPLAEIDGLPPQVIREMGRQKKFINIQSSINQMDFEVGTALASVATQIRKKISLAKSIELKSQGEALRIKNRIQAGRKARKGADPVGMAEMTREIRHHENIVIQQRYLQTVFKESLLQFAKYKANVTKRINREIAQLKSSANKELALTMKDMISNLGRFLENNELLKYEVYAGAGENIRYRVAGGKGQKLRAPAAIEEIEKNMNWEFEGEVWADEVGHFRSNLKNLCPELNTAGGR